MVKNNINILRVFTEKPYSKLLERNVVKFQNNLESRDVNEAKTWLSTI